MFGVRSGLGSALSGVVVAGLVGALPVAAAGAGVRGSAPQLAAQATRAAVVVPWAAGRARPTVVLRSTPKLVVNVNPNLSGSRSWTFTLQRKTAGVWQRVGVYQTRGTAEVRRLRVQAGTYRVRVHARCGYRAVTTTAYRHTPTVVTTRVSVRSDGGQAEGGQSYSSAVSAEGRWITYTSEATNLVNNDTNLQDDVFLFDRVTKRTRRVSVGSDGGQANRASSDAAISADGRWITYTSEATNLVGDDSDFNSDVFLYDRVTKRTRRVSVRTDGGQADSNSYEPAISADGRWTTYSSRATNLVANDTNNQWDVFLFDRDTATTRRVSVGTDGRQADRGSSEPAISADGRWTTYASKGRNLVANDTNGKRDVFLFDRDTATTRRVSVGTDGRQADRGSSEPAISADGRWTTYASKATNLVANDTNGRADVFLFDRDTATTRRVSVGTDGGQATGTSDDPVLSGSSSPAISADGRWIAYQSRATNLVGNDTNDRADVFLFDRDTATTRRVSVRSDGDQADGARTHPPFGSIQPAISADGRRISYRSGATNLVSNDTNSMTDVFLTRMW